MSRGAMLLVSALLACGCGNGYRKAGGGEEYRVVERDADAVPVGTGQCLELRVTQVYGVTVLPRERVPARRPGIDFAQGRSYL